jgi:hypothetical protein
MFVSLFYEHVKGGHASIIINPEREQMSTQ